MSTTKYLCTNFAGCNKALEREVIEIEDGEEPICPEKDCGCNLDPVKKTGPVKIPKWVFAVVAVVLLAAGLGFWLTHQPAKSNPAPKLNTHVVPPPPPGPVVPNTAPVVPVAPDPCGDKQMAANLQDRFGRDEDLKAEAIQVDVANKTVILSGTVSSALARTYAVDVVGKSGCQAASVVNNLKIDSDKMIASRIQQSFSKEPTLRAQHIQVDVSRGNVVLSGSVAENLIRTVAASTAGQIRGVATVTNNIRVQASAPSTPAQDLPLAHASQPKTNLTGTWVGSYESCAQGHTDISMRITESAPDDIMVSAEIAMPNSASGTFTSHGILNTLNSFLSLQFSGWQHQPAGLSVGDIGGYVTYVNQRPAEFSGIIRPPGCGQISLKKR
jgi:osmotically-inducible protein OsmY